MTIETREPSPAPQSTLSERCQLHTIEIAATPEEIWRELTRTGRIRPFYLSTILRSELRPGASIECASSAGLLRNFGYVLEIEPPQRLLRTFDSPGSDAGKTIVEWRIQARDGGAIVSLEHRELRKHTTLYAQLAWVWPQILAALKEYVEVYCRAYPRDWPLPNPFFDERA